MAECLSKNIFSNECIFRLSSSINTQNVGISGTERRVEGREEFSHGQSVMACCRISVEMVERSYFFEDENVYSETTETC